MLQPDKVFTAVQFDSSALTYAYEWKLPSSPFSQQLVEEAKALVSPLSDFMQPADLRCTSHGLTNIYLRILQLKKYNPNMYVYVVRKAML